MMILLAGAMTVGLSISIDSQGGASFSTDALSNFSNDGLGCSWVCLHLGGSSLGAA